MTLLQAVLAFRKSHLDYLEPEGADGMCGIASCEFVEFLERNKVKLNYKPHTIDYDRRTARHYPIKVEFLRRNQDWYDIVYEGGTGNWSGHTVVGIGPLRIDWTARQFDYKVHVPFVWRARYWPKFKNGKTEGGYEWPSHMATPL